MHELSVATAVLNTAVKHARGRRVKLVAVHAGALRQVVPESLRFYWS
jgi:Zn finger protein HypA/HybF involved in hydrogenase expression